MFQCVLAATIGQENTDHRKGKTKGDSSPDCLAPSCSPARGGPPLLRGANRLLIHFESQMARLNQEALLRATNSILDDKKATAKKDNNTHLVR